VARPGHWRPGAVAAGVPTARHGMAVRASTGWWSGRLGGAPGGGEGGRHGESSGSPGGGDERRREDGRLGGGVGGRVELQAAVRAAGVALRAAARSSVPSNRHASWPGGGEGGLVAHYAASMEGPGGADTNSNTPNNNTFEGVATLQYIIKI
jgi:hypothetical protein